MTDSDATTPSSGATPASGTSPEPAEASAAEEAARPQRPATVIFTQTTLALQAFAALFAVLTVWGLGRAGVLEVSGAAVWGLGFGFVALLAYAVGQQGKPRGHAWGWALQVPMLVAGFVLPAIAVIGAVFLAIWITGLRVGSKIDRERAERLAVETEAREASATAAPAKPAPTPTPKSKAPPRSTPTPKGQA